MKPKFATLLPIMQTSLPPLSCMMPYLNQIESNRCHSNFGKLFKLFEERMADLFCLSANQCGIFCNGTTALVLGLMALTADNHSAKKYCLMPSWTFSATPAAALLAGLTPYFLDVDKDTQRLTPEIVKQSMLKHNISPESVAAVVTVAPFGAPISREQWDIFTCEMNIPVMIDAAAAFDTILQMPEMSVGTTPMMVSLHATKIFGIGEGGMLLSTNEELIKRLKAMSNFGFDTSRLSSFAGMNAKMSEYQAAIGLGVLDAWREIRVKRLQLTEMYLRLCQKLELQSWLSTDWLSSTCNVLIPNRAVAARDYLIDHNIESRIWWNSGCHSYPAYQTCPRVDDLVHTHYFSKAMVGLPCSLDTNELQIELVGEVLQEFISSSEQRENSPLYDNVST